MLNGTFQGFRGVEVTVLSMMLKLSRVLKVSTSRLVDTVENGQPSRPCSLATATA
jgi:hypothetical protein